MDGHVGTRVYTTSRPPGGRSYAASLALVVLLALPVSMAVGPAAAAAQQDTVRAGVPDTAVADTVPVDTTLTPRERALRRLRALPLTPVQPDTMADTVAVDSTPAWVVLDSLGQPVDSLMPDRDSVAAAADSLRRTLPEGLRLDTLRAPPDSQLTPQPPDTISRFLGPDPIVLREGAMRTGGATRAADPPSPAEAQIREQLRELEGYVSTEYRTADRAVFWADSNRLELTGDSRIDREGSVLETDSLLVYDGDRSVVCGYGEPVLSGEADPVTSNRVCFDIDRDVGMAQGARTRFSQGATWYVRGPDNRIFVLTGAEKSTLYGQRAQFTSCDLDHPHYAFQAQSLKMVEGEMMVARDVTLRFEDVPVFWLPWMVQSMKRGRRSGLLMPQFGVNDIVRNSTGYNRYLSNLGFYWAVSDYVSTRGTFEWYASNWMALDGGLTYYWRRQFLQGSVNAKHFWRQQDGVPAGREFTLNTSNSWQPDENTSLRLNANYASSTRFVRDNSFDPRELNQSIRSSASANRQFGWGSLTLGADRRQQLSTGQVDWTLPSLNLSLSPITIYSNDSGFDVTWTGSGNATRRTRDVQEDSLPSVRDSDALDAGFNHRVSAGRLSLSQRLQYQQETLGAKPALGLTPGDTLALAEETGERLNWSTSLSYQQSLWTGTTLSPQLSVSGRQLRDQSTRDALAAQGQGTGAFVSEPLRLSSGASLTTAIYGFWPGVGNFTRIRHKIAPSLSWSYSPAPTTTALQDSVFGARNLREQNRISLSFSQTFEAKLAGDEDETQDTVILGQPGEPQRLPQAEKITLLALNTGTPFIYDFVAADEDGRGFLTDQVTNSIRSDLLRGLQLTVAHDLFEEGETPADGGLAPRTFAPFMTRLSASFSIDHSFWLFRLLGLSQGDEPEAAGQAAEGRDMDPEAPEGPGGAESRPGGVPGGVGSMVPSRDAGRGGARPGVGRWQAQLSYSMQRSRPGVGSPANDNATLQASISFDPTEHWSVRWNTGYSFTQREFSNHFLTLSRDLHRWTANFDFIKAQNGNFAMSFRVQLRDNPDLKVDYDQRTRTPARGSALNAPPVN